jgi:hypothetical protein
MTQPARATTFMTSNSIGFTPLSEWKPAALELAKEKVVYEAMKGSGGNLGATLSHWRPHLK